MTRVEDYLYTTKDSPDAPIPDTAVEDALIEAIGQAQKRAF